jgi:hypothetical protein
LTRSLVAGFEVIPEAWYGTGDHEDPPEVAEDRRAETFEVRYDPAGEAGTLSTGGGQYSSLGSARASAEAACGPSVRWKGER